MFCSRMLLRVGANSCPHTRGRARGTRDSLAGMNASWQAGPEGEAGYRRQASRHRPQRQPLR
jgi:hypothetical protein